MQDRTLGSIRETLVAIRTSKLENLKFDFGGRGVVGCEAPFANKCLYSLTYPRQELDWVGALSLKKEKKTLLKTCLFFTLLLITYDITKFTSLSFKNAISCRTVFTKILPHCEIVF